ncbi:MAG: General secretory pathway protein E [Candidatus Roizmanbacteria bacterium GW2011_GWA2_33_33]|uniref:General secretory pathway protein E n=2 Tax=Candidatus Roizmaniibacteriota TaxID=1752723 RepID=A0A0G0E142_9BACT|nr:MAG: General secretory pathway protein E [Candidatus Roizmanbacteria bacterium GW2011_GWA2_33_33]KKP61097.1 MAG: General secretory pathway protein E [Candidatus Roizmanbacteria bacterium GW2011_GWC2_34_23]
MNVSPKLLLGQLVKNKQITEAEANQYEVASLQKDVSIIDYLYKYTNLQRIEIVKAQAEIEKITYVDLEKTPIDSEAVGLVSESISRRYKIIPYLFDSINATISIATEDPFDRSIIDFLEKKTGKKIILSLADKEQIIKMIDLSFSQGLSPEVRDALKEYSPDLHKEINNSNVQLQQAPIAKIVSTILEFSVKGRASDIHIEPEETRTKVRYRIDGILQEKLSLPRTIHEALISRIKILGEMKIDEKRIPQDGRFTYKSVKDEVDLRVSTLPTVFGEKVVMRLLKKTGGIPSLSDLGFGGPQLKELEEAIAKPYGIILITGPTGSGKTTTLYSILSRLNKPTVNIVTLEDPVEYQIAGINQVQINVQAGLTFATGLRAFLRQDPNIILVGEVRDKETTQLAIQAALTGHLVFSTLHTNDAATAIPRLIDLGAESFLIASVLTAILGQRISRKICPYCKASYPASAEVTANIKSVLGPLFPKKFESTPVLLSKGKGCQECNQTGYLGRIAIFEILKVTTAINQHIIHQDPAEVIEKTAKKEGFVKMIEDGYLKVLDGVTTMEEVLRVAET